MNLIKRHEVKTESKDFSTLSSVYFNVKLSANQTLKVRKSEVKFDSKLPFDAVK